MAERAAVVNRIRVLLLEFGVIVPQRVESVRRDLHGHSVPVYEAGLSAGSADAPEPRVCRLASLHPRVKYSSIGTLVLASAFAAQGASSQSVDQLAPLQKSQPRDTVVITAGGSQMELPVDYAGGQIARGGRVGLFGNLDLMDTPFSATSYTAELIAAQQASSVADVVQADSAVRVARGSGNFQELYVVRGSPVYSDDVSYNGLYGLMPRQYVATEFLERVEVFRGANTFLNGAAPSGSGIGGAINLVPKHAPDERIDRLTLGFENESQGFGAADFSRRLGEEREFGIRFNAARHGGDDSIENENGKLGVLSLGTDYRGDRARLSVDVGWQDHRVDAPRPSVTPTAGIPPVPAASSNFAQRWTHAQERDVFGVARGEYAVGGGAQLWAAVGVRSGTEYNVLGNPRSDAAGNTTTFRFDNYRRDLVATGEIGARVPFRTGGVKHSISASGAIFDLNSENAFGFSSLTGFAGNLYDPIDVAPPAANVRTGGVLFSPLTTNTIKTSSGALADVLSVAEGRALLTVGARYQVIRQYSYDYNTGDKTTPGYDKNAVTPVVGLAVKPVKPLLLYANYIQALTQGAVAPPMVGSVVVSNSGEVFSPFRSVQYEIGAKYDRGDVVSTLAVFRIAEPSALLDGDVYRQEGEQRNQGIELNLFGEPWAGVRVLGGVTFLDARMTRTQNGTNNGNRVIGVPKEQVNAGVDWDLRAVHGLTLGGRIVYTGSQVADGGNTRSIPPWARLDLDAHYGLPLTGYRLLVRANVVNVTNQDYWASVGGTPGGTYLVLGEPRTFVVSLSVEF